MKKYIFIGSSSFPGAASGISQSVYAQIQALHNAGYSVLCFTPTTKKFGIKETLESFSEFHYHGVDSESLEELRCMVELYNKYQPEMIINNDNPYLSNLMQFARCAKLSICHMNKTTINSLTVYDGAFAHRIGAISHYMLSYLRSKLSDKHKVIFVPNIFIPPLNELPSPSDIALSETAKNKIKLLYSGGSNSNKGIRYIRDLLAKINNSQLSKSIQVDLFGQYNKNDVIFFEGLKNLEIYKHGFTPSNILYNYLKKADFLLFPSLNEGLPMTIIEALSARTAILSIDGVGGVCDLVLNGYNGICVDSKDWVDLSVAYLAQALTRPQKLEQLKVNGYAVFNVGFSQHQFISQVKEITDLYSTDKDMVIDIFKQKATEKLNLRLLHWHRVPKGHIKYSKLVGIKQRLGILPKKEYFI